jgi:hypothetical protein
MPTTKLDLSRQYSEHEQNSRESARVRLNAFIGPIGPLELHRVCADRLRFPGANVSDLTIRIVIPALPRNRIGDGLAQFMRAGRGEGREGI